jgi:hypothetical protein
MRSVDHLAFAQFLIQSTHRRSVPRGGTCGCFVCKRPNGQAGFTANLIGAPLHRVGVIGLVRCAQIGRFVLERSGQVFPLRVRLKLRLGQV